MNIIIKPKPDKDKMITIHKKKKELTDMTIRGLFVYVHELEAENARLEELYQKSVGVIAATNCAECKDKPVKHGEWVDVKFSEGVFKDNDDSNNIGLSITSAKCSLCQRYSDNLQQYSPKMPAYCSHCGAKMDGGADDELSEA